MRKLKKYIRNLKTFYLNRDKIRKAKMELKKHFGIISFKFSSFGGADMNYYVLKNDKIFGVLRLAITDHKDNARPIVRFVKEKRLDKEYFAYSNGSKLGLTPNVLYKSKEMLLCEYLNGERVFSLLKRDTSKVWEILADAVKIYKKLHDVNITHLDATLKNFIIYKGQMKVIDFEYYPANSLSIETQKAYDYVRIIEHTLRTIPNEYQNDYAEFIEYLKDTVPEKVKLANFTLVEPWMKNIRHFDIYPTLKNEIFLYL